MAPSLPLRPRSEDNLTPSPEKTTRLNNYGDVLAGVFIGAISLAIVLIWIFPSVKTLFAVKRKPRINKTRTSYDGHKQYASNQVPKLPYSKEELESLKRMPRSQSVPKDFNSKREHFVSTRRMSEPSISSGKLYYYSDGFTSSTPLSSISGSDDTVT